MTSRKQPPILNVGPLSGKVYIATRYRVLDAAKGHYEALEKFDVTEEFEALSAARAGAECVALRHQLEKARQELNVCERCGHRQAEPNWCQKCGHRCRMAPWAVAFLKRIEDEKEQDRGFLDAETERAERAEAALTEAREWATGQRDLWRDAARERFEAAGKPGEPGESYATGYADAMDEALKALDRAAPGSDG